MGHAVDGENYDDLNHRLSDNAIRRPLKPPLLLRQLLLLHLPVTDAVLDVFLLLFHVGFHLL